ncbi:MAG: LiaF transmembrane domain-containing protein [Eubacteriales bacterium]
MSSKNVVGIILVILGIGFFLQQADVIEFNEIISSYWPSIIIMVGIIQLFKKNISYIAGLITICVGVLLQLHKIDILPNDFSGYIWPSILVLVGIAFIFSRAFKEKINVKEEGFIDNIAIFGAVETKNTTKNFKGGSITAIFGGAEIDLREAKLEEDGVDLELTAVFGGITIWVPKNWRVMATGVPIFGGWDNNTVVDESNEEVKTINIRCTAIFGGMDIKN